MSLRPCSSQPCPALVESGSGVTRCPAHQEQHQARQRANEAAYDRARGSFYARGGDSRWKALRNEHLAANPMCAQCLREGRRTPAKMVDHIVPHRGDDALRLDPYNLQSLCLSCHGKKTANEGPGYRPGPVRPASPRGGGRDRG